MFLFYLNN